MLTDSCGTEWETAQTDSADAAWAVESSSFAPAGCELVSRGAGGVVLLVAKPQLPPLGAGVGADGLCGRGVVGRVLILLAGPNLPLRGSLGNANGHLGHGTGGRGCWRGRLLPVN